MIWHHLGTLIKFCCIQAHSYTLVGLVSIGYLVCARSDSESTFHSLVFYYCFWVAGNGLVSLAL